MAGVWVFKNGVIRLGEGSEQQLSPKKVLVHIPTDQVVSSYSLLQQILTELGWEIYNQGDPELLQFHKVSSINLISLPLNFNNFNFVHMYDILVKNPNVFLVKDA